VAWGGRRSDGDGGGTGWRNNHGDVKALTGPSGTPTATYGYTAYGSPVTSMFTGADGRNASPGPNVVPYNSYRFNAMPWDPGSGQYNMGARNYQPGLGSFNSRDMYAGASADMAMTGDPLAAAPTPFDDANPISNIEPDGHCWSGFGFVCSAASTVVSGLVSGYHDFINGARSARHVMAAGARIAGHGIAAAKAVGSATGITDAINCIRNPPSRDASPPSANSPSPPPPSPRRRQPRPRWLVLSGPSGQVASAGCACACRSAARGVLRRA
jgi:RHS repeat-associated protein